MMHLGVSVIRKLLLYCDSVTEKKKKIGYNKDTKEKHGT